MSVNISISFSWFVITASAQSVLAVRTPRQETRCSQPLSLVTFNHFVYIKTGSEKLKKVVEVTCG